MSAVERTHLDQARSRLREQGARVTQARTRVLAELLAADSALSHADVLRMVEQAPLGEVFDRVTLYRVLDWLVDQHLAHRLTGVDRVYRFSAHGDTEHGHPSGKLAHDAHGHFRCRMCERMFCLAEAPGIQDHVQASVPNGFTPEKVEVTVLGRCANCARQ
jgi:Fur family transcriptional regulator, ferric uptake regulator